MHVFKNDVIDWVVASSEEDAKAAYAEYMGAMGCTEHDYEPHTWVRLPDRQLLAIHDEDGGRYEKTCAEWVEAKGRGFLCSTEY